MPFLGFGQLTSILTGIYAAYDICGKGNYEKLTQPIRKSYHTALVLRRVLEKMDNSKFDLMVKSLSGYMGNKIFNSKNIDFLKLSSYLLRPLAFI